MAKIWERQSCRKIESLCRLSKWKRKYEGVLLLAGSRAHLFFALVASACRIKGLSLKSLSSSPSSQGRNKLLCQNSALSSQSEASFSEGTRLLPSSAKLEELPPHFLPNSYVYNISNFKTSSAYYIFCLMSSFSSHLFCYLRIPSVPFIIFCQHHRSSCHIFSSCDFQTVIIVSSFSIKIFNCMWCMKKGWESCVCSTQRMPSRRSNCTL